MSVSEFSPESALVSTPELPVYKAWSDELEIPTRHVMEFHLVYAGDLLKGSSKCTWEKHQIRRYLHPQLKNLWETHPLLNFYTQDNHMDRRGKHIVFEQHDSTKIESIATHFEGFVPLVMEEFGMACELDILFLRAQPAGSILHRGGTGGGDIDNRLKNLLDALCMPTRGQVKLKETDNPDPSPFYVLLQDDSLITSVKLKADRFLAVPSDAPDSEACVIIKVDVKVADPTALPYGINL